MLLDSNYLKPGQSEKMELGGNVLKEPVRYYYRERIEKVRDHIRDSKLDIVIFSPNEKDYVSLNTFMA